MVTRVALLAVGLTAWLLCPADSVAEHWSQGVATHANGPMDFPKPNMLGRVAHGTGRVVRASWGVVYTGATLPFKLTAGAVRAFRSDEPQVANSRSKSDSSAGFASVLSRESSPRPATVTEWMRQPRPE
jgi:hypothetical protein